MRNLLIFISSMIYIISFFGCRHHLKVKWPRQSTKNSCLKEKGVPCLLKNGSALLLDLGKVFNWPKYLKALIEAHDAVVIDDMTSWVQFYSKTVDSMSNESPNKVLQYARARCWAQFLKCGRILVCSSIHAAAVLSWTSKSATPSKASWSQFESLDNGWHLKQKL